LVRSANFSGTGSLWLTCDDQLLEARIRSQTDFYRGASDEVALISNILRRSSLYNELMIGSAMEFGAAVIKVWPWHSVDDVADLCESALTMG